ncbi:hypothetical protein, partial [Pseudomonas viridiflava]|uniref:hypothetical protein n=1 Tax=Pseudomonas viridiflava TaxID=33069 RepID=UPI0019680EAC
MIEPLSSFAESIATDFLQHVETTIQKRNRPPFAHFKRRAGGCEPEAIVGLLLGHLVQFGQFVQITHRERRDHEGHM